MTNIRATFAQVFSIGVLLSTLCFSNQSAANLLQEYSRILQTDEQQALQFLRQNYPFSSENPDQQFELLKKYTETLIENEQSVDADTAYAKTLDLATKMGNKGNLAECQALNVGLLFLHKKSLDAQSLIAPLLDEVANLPPASQYFVFKRVGKFYNEINRFEPALSMFNKASMLLDYIVDPQKKNKLSLLTNIAVLQMNLKEWHGALETLEQAISISIASGNDRYLSTLYINQSYILTELNQLDAANEIDLKALAIAKKYNNQQAILTTLNNLADSYMRQHKFAQARQLFKEAQDLAWKLGAVSTLRLVKANLLIVDIYETGNEALIEPFLAVVSQYQQEEKWIDVEYLYRDLAEALGYQGNYKLQALYLQKQIDTANSVFQSERAQALAELQDQYESQNKSKQIEILQQQNQINQIQLENTKLQQKLMFAVALIISLLLAISLNFYRKARLANRKLSNLNKTLAEQNLKDPLTGLFNRRALPEYLKASDSPSLGFLLVDVDHFKHVNDSYGHNAGDAVLVEIAKRLQDSTRQYDRVLRWGGEEFLIVAQGDNQAMQHLCQRVLNNISHAPITFENTEINCTISVGFICLPFANLSTDQFDHEQAIQLADMALYMSKMNGRNRGYGVLNTTATEPEAIDDIVKDLSKAVEQGRVTVQCIQS